MESVQWVWAHNGPRMRYSISSVRVGESVDTGPNRTLGAQIRCCRAERQSGHSLQQHYCLLTA